jgi:hypothetical protein
MEKFSLKTVSEAYQAIYEESDEIYEMVVDFLANEGLVETYEEADELIELMSDEELDFVVSEARGVPLRHQVAQIILNTKPSLVSKRRRLANTLIKSEINHPISRKPDSKRRFSGKAANPNS